MWKAFVKVGKEREREGEKDNRSGNGSEPKAGSDFTPGSASSSDAGNRVSIFQ